MIRIQIGQKRTDSAEWGGGLMSLDQYLMYVHTVLLGICFNDYFTTSQQGCQGQNEDT